MDASQLCRIQIKHTYREGNILADYLANMAFDTTGKFEIYNFSDLPNQARRILNLDKQQVTNLRIRTKNIKPYIMCGEEEGVFIS